MANTFISVALNVKNCTKERDSHGTEWEETRPGETADKACEKGLDGMYAKCAFRLSICLFPGCYFLIRGKIHFDYSLGAFLLVLRETTPSSMAAFRFKYNT